MPYTPQFKPNQLIYGNPDCQTVIVCGWTPKETVARHVDAKHYAAIGQLYNPARGINYLVRNLLANPHIRWLVTLGVTKEDINAGAVDSLNHFFTHGVTEGVSDEGRECWVINSRVPGYIDKVIPVADLNDLRDRIGNYEGGSTKQDFKEVMTDTARLISGLAEWGYKDPTRPVKTYPFALPSSNTKPSSVFGHKVEADTIAECWLKILHRIRTNGTLRPTGYDGQWQELIDLVAVVNNEPEDFYFPEPNYLPVDRPFIDSYLSSMVDDAPVKEGVKYTYGQRIRSHFGRDQVQDVVNKLKAERDSASAVISLWDASRDNLVGGSPCLNHLWFRVVTLRGSERLALTATFRSNDMYSAWPANAMGLRHLQRIVRDALDLTLPLGPLVTISQSAHFYDETFDSADRVLRTHYKPHRVTYSDPVGNFVIERQFDKVVVEQTTPEGEEVGQFTATSPLLLIREVVAANPSIDPAHAAYLGLEIQKAFSNDKYVQDRG